MKSKYCECSLCKFKIDLNPYKTDNEKIISVLDKIFKQHPLILENYYKSETKNSFCPRCNKRSFI